MTSKFETFLFICQHLNRKLDAIPLLYGSLGLSRVLGDDLQPDDIDLLIDPLFIGANWQALQDTMYELNFSLVDEHEHEFQCNETSVAFGDVSSLIDFAGIDPATLPITMIENVRFLELTAEQYLTVYRASQKDGYRQQQRGKKDGDKIRLIEAFLKAGQ